MILVRQHVLRAVCLAALASNWMCAQEQRTTPAAPAAPAQQPASPAPAAPRPADDSGYISPSIGVFYWFNPGHLHLKNGHGAVIGDNPADLDYPGKNQGTPGAVITLPAGRYNSLQVSYWRTRGKGTTVAPKDLRIYSQDYSAGDLLNTRYALQNAKVSWEYLTFPVPPGERSLRVKTLWQLQFTSIKEEIIAPLLETDTTSTYVTKNRWFVYPSIGLGLEKPFSKTFRWEAKASGFMLPHRSAIWDAETFFAVRGTHIEVKFGGKAFYFKTSPKQSEYLRDTLPGGFLEVSWHGK